MANMVDIFSDDAFGLVSLTKSINKMPFRPSKLGAMGLFAETGITTTTASIEEKAGVLTLLPTAARGAPGLVGHSDKSTLRSFAVPHIPHQDAIMADAVQGLRAFGSEDSAESVVKVVSDRLEAMRQRHELTHEYHRIGAIQGKVLDADGTTVLFNFFTEFGVTEKSIDFLLGTGGTKIRKKVLVGIRHIEKILGASNYTRIHVMCGHEFFDSLISHADVEAAYARWQTGEFLRNDPRSGFQFAGVTFEEYRGKVGNIPFIAPNKARMFPVGVPDLFLTNYAPANYMETVNTVGLPVYAKQEAMEMNKGVKLETQSNPFTICTRPQTCVELTTSN